MVIRNFVNKAFKEAANKQKIPKNPSHTKQTPTEMRLDITFQITSDV